MAGDCACDCCAEAAQAGADDDYAEVSHVLFLHDACGLACRSRLRQAQIYLLNM